MRMAGPRSQIELETVSLLKPSGCVRCQDGLSTCSFSRCCL